MRIKFYIASEVKLKELMLQTGCRQIYRFKDKKITFPTMCLLVGNDVEKFLWI